MTYGLTKIVYISLGTITTEVAIKILPTKLPSEKRSKEMNKAYVMFLIRLKTIIPI